MSKVRRAKTFSVKKSNENDGLSVPNFLLRLSPLPRRRRLPAKEKSVSLENVPLRLQLESNELFNKQRLKREDEEKEAKVVVATPVAHKRTRLKKRKSVSFDDVRFPRLVDDLEKDIVLRPRGSTKRELSRYKTVDVLKDLITDCENETKHSVDNNLVKPGNFPLPEDEEVHVRTRYNNKQERPRTYASSLTTKKKEDPLDLKGVTRLEIGRDICVKVRTGELLRLSDGYLQLLDEKLITKATIRKNVTFNKNVTLTGKRELEMRDSESTIYHLYFESSRDTKNFVETVKTYYTTPTTSAFKNIGPWWQLRKLLKKRSSRDLLESKGIIKNEPIFGNTLEELCTSEHPVPEVITRIVRLIEIPENIKSMGLYRASANLAVVQNIRFEINCGKWDILEHYKNDVDVLAGTLKLFFRELKEPLISYEVYQQLQKAMAKPSKNEINSVINRLPRPHRDTLLYIVKHLLNVCRHKEDNKMDLHNIAICWGPSLITIPETCTDLVTQTTEFTKITEDLLVYYSTEMEQNNDEPDRPRDFVFEVVRKLTEIIERSIDVEGIYRKSGSNTKIEKILKTLEKENMTEIESGKNDIHDLCCVLKKYLQTLRTSIVPDEFFFKYLEICDRVDNSTLNAEINRMVSDLPRKDLVYLIFEHLRKVVAHERKNKMSYKVLSEIWLTTLMSNTVTDQNHKQKKPKYLRLFEILMNLNKNQKTFSEVTKSESKRIYSNYDNVPDDIQDDAETQDKVYTKL